MNRNPNETAESGRSLVNACAVRRANWEHMLGDGENELGRRVARLVLDAMTAHGVDANHLALLLETREGMTSQEAGQEVARIAKHLGRIVAELREAHPAASERSVAYLLAGYFAPPTLAALREDRDGLLAARAAVVQARGVPVAVDEGLRDAEEMIAYVVAGGCLPPRSQLISRAEVERERARILAMRP